MTGLAESLTEDGVGYNVRCSYGLANTPDDAIDLAGALQVADRRMYLNKRERRGLAGQSTERAGEGT